MTVGSRLLSLFTLSSVAVIICSLQATPVAALSVDLHVARDRHLYSNTARDLHHEALAKRKRSSTLNKRCKPRPAAPGGGASPPPQTPAPAAPKAVSSPPPQHATSSTNGGILNLQGTQRAALAWPNGDQDLPRWDSAKLMYTWSPDCPASAKSLGILCCHMLWGRDFVSEWQNKILNSPTPIECVMGVNEPEIPSQSNMSPGEAASLWKQYIEPLKSKWGTFTIGPAVTDDEPRSTQWIQQFLADCQGCRIDAFATHWYDVNGDALIAWVEKVHQITQRMVWLSEFACQNFNGGPQCSQAQVDQFHATVTPYLQNSPHVLAYSAFGAMHQMQGVNPLNQLMNPDGSPNGLARAYGYGSHA